MVVLEFYRERISELETRLNQLKKRKSGFGILRLGTVLAIILAFYFLSSFGILYVGITVLALLIIFTRLVLRDIENKNAILHIQFLLQINQDEIKALEGNYNQFPDGAAYLPKEHAYAQDMDVLGHASVFQYLNRTGSEPGAELLANWLLEPASVATLLERQTAFQELSKKIIKVQQLQAVGKETVVRNNTRQQIAAWMKQPDQFIIFKHWQWIRYLLPAIMVGITIGCIFGYLSLNYLYIGLLLMGILSYQINKIIAPIHNALSYIVDELDIVSRSILIIEKEQFQSPSLIALQNNLKGSGLAASVQIKKLKQILERLDLRYNVAAAVPLNFLLLWNLHQVLDLEKWKQQQHAELDKWFDVLANFEALSSFAILHFNHPQWAIPKFRAEHFYIEGIEVGHPLIPKQKRVSNPVPIHQKGNIMLITGSNMAGKSTYLRSVGVNVILAMAGAPVCASRFELSPVQLMSSMRIADNLEESTSTFYAELKKLQNIIEKVNAGEKIFVLLDEILRGTNSHDRHTGSDALIKQLIRKNASAILATHDLALAKIEKDYPNHILNFHFDVQVNQDELFFDYQLKPGICTSMNASILMKKVGIEL